MKLKLALGLMLLAAPLAAQNAADERAVQALWQQFEAAFNAGDAAKIGTLFTPTADRISGSGAPMHGAQEIARQYGAMLVRRAADTSAVPLQAAIKVRFLRNDVALLDAEWNGRRATQPVAGRFTMIAVKNKGRWLFDAGRAWEFDAAPNKASQTDSLAIGETFTIQSRILNETRRINLYAPTIYLDSANTPLPVLYMPDGGIAEDFLHIAGLVQVSVGNGTMRPFLLVGIENTQRRRDMTPPTADPEDRKIAPQVGGSAEFRAFIRDELMPEIKRRYRTTAETAIMGESLAGLFVVETFLLEPDLFDTYIAFDPSVWWDQGRLVRTAPQLLQQSQPNARLYMASSNEPEMQRLIGQLSKLTPHTTYQPMPEETHGTIYHPAALRALRVLFAPENAQ